MIKRCSIDYYNRDVNGSVIMSLSLIGIFSL